LSLRDVLFDHPSTIVLGCAIWLPLGFWVLYLVQKMVMAEIDALAGLIGVIVALVIGFLALKPPDPRLTPVLFVGTLLTMMMYPAVSRALNQRALDQVEIEAAEDQYELILMNPNNRVAMFRLAKSMYKRGLVGSAIAIAEMSVEGMPGNVVYEERRSIALWKRSPLPIATTLACLECGHQNALQSLRCERCGCKHLMDHLAGRWVGKKLARQWLGAWAACMLALIGLPLIFMKLEGGIAFLCAGGVLLMVAGILVYALAAGERR
jgi:hypothetical protein